MPEPVVEHAGARVLTSGSVEGIMQTVVETLRDETRTLEIRLWIVYTTTDDGKSNGTAAPGRAALLPMVEGLVEAMRMDWADTGIEFVFLPERDFEIRQDSELNRDHQYSADALAQFPAAEMAFTAEQIKALNDAANTDPARHAVARERPGALLMLISEKEILERVGAMWQHSANLAGSYSGWDKEYVMLNKHDFAVSEQKSRDDASRAVHEMGHFFLLPHTHREHPYPEDVPTGLHDEYLTPEQVAANPSDADRLKIWQGRIESWIDRWAPAGTTPEQALKLYDIDRYAKEPATVSDTNADPGPGIIALANLVAGHGDDAMGLEKVTVNPANVTGPVTFDPDRRNPMSYFLHDAGGTPMRFSSDQRRVMRTALLHGSRHRLVAAQLGETAFPGTHVCAVWSPGAHAQLYSARKSLDDHRALVVKHDDQLHLASQCASVRNTEVIYDGIWNADARPQEFLWGYTEADAQAEIAKKAQRGWRVTHVQAYKHPDAGLRYNAIFERGDWAQTVLLGRTGDELHTAWGGLMPLGNRIGHLDAAIDEHGVARYAVVFDPGSQVQHFAQNLTAVDVAAEYERSWNSGSRLGALSVAATPTGVRYTGVWNSEAANQLVLWSAVRERINEVYDEMWWKGFRLRSLHVTST